MTTVATNQRDQVGIRSPVSQGSSPGAEGPMLLIPFCQLIFAWRTHGFVLHLKTTCWSIMHLKISSLQAACVEKEISPSLVVNVGNCIVLRRTVRNTPVFLTL